MNTVYTNINIIHNRKVNHLKINDSRLQIDFSSDNGCGVFRFINDSVIIRSGPHLFRYITKIIITMLISSKVIITYSNDGFACLFNENK